MEELLENLEYLEDGVYDITGLKYYFVEDGDENEIEAFLDMHPHAVCAKPYETYTTILLSDEPQTIPHKDIHGELNYGSAAIITNCPKTILICAEND